MRFIPGVITKAALSLDSGGVLVALIEVNTSQGTYEAQVVALDNYRADLGRRAGSAYGCDYLRQLMETVGVTDWETLLGSRVRIHLDRDRLAIAAIHHATSDRTWDPIALGGVH